jgi:hypothetical protein
MKKSNNVSREILVEDLNKVQNKWSKNNKGILTREYYRQNGKFSTFLIEKVFGSFNKAKKECDLKKEKTTRESFNIFKSNKKINKKYFISSIIAGAPIKKEFIDSINQYCIENNTELILLVMRGVEIKSAFDKEIIEKYSKYFCTEFQFNSNIIAKDFMLNPQQILPLTGLQRYGGKSQSIIVAHSKQMMITVPKPHNDFPHLVLSTGTICLPNYRNTRQGQIAKEDNCLSGIILEVKNDNIFFLRTIRFDGKGFQDLNKYYTSEKVINKNANSIIIEPHFGEEDKEAFKIYDEVIDLCKPKNVFMHDSFDAGSVNPHELNKIGVKCKRKSVQKTLEDELVYFGNCLQKLEEKYKATYYHVYSNHNLFVDRYLENGDFIKDSINVKIGAELFLALINNENPIEYYLKKNFDLKDQIFLKRGESFQVSDCEMNIHGHISSNGRRGNAKSIEISSNSAIIGHSHSPSIWRSVICIPTLSNLQQEYNMDGASSWLQGVGLLFESGEKQIILNINKEWKL